MNRVGEGGKGESVWLGWLLLRTIEMFAPLASVRDPTARLRWRAHAASVRAALEREAWDGAWYRRATFDDGTWLGSSESEACRIDSIAQSWAVLSGAADPARAATAMASLDGHLDPPLMSAWRSCSAAVRRNDARSRLHQRLSAGSAGEWRPVQPRRHVGDPCVRQARSGQQGRKLVRHVEPHQPRQHARPTPNATKSSLSSPLPTSTPSRPMSGAADGPGTRARPA